jgi:long-chain acyl-CoA synthetase
MFSRMLKLPIRGAQPLRPAQSLEIAVHAAAPCPVQVKEQMIEWWGPIIHEYYGATEAMGFTACDTPRVAGHRGTVGRVLMGDLHILDENMQPVPKGTPGEIWFKTANPFEYFNDPERTAEAPLGRRHHEHGGRRGLCRRRRLPLPDRPLDLHDHLGRREHLPAGMREPADHPPEGGRCRGLRRAQRGLRRRGQGRRAADARHGQAHARATASRADRLLPASTWRATRCPRSVDFIDQMPRLPTGKLYKKPLREAAP